MSGQGVRWTAEQVLALAPDAASRRSGSKLALPGPWSEAGAGGGAVWGLCKGSGSRPYRTVVDVDGRNAPGYTCSCPSRKFPCKHALGLLLLWAAGEPAVREDVRQEAPGWAEEWLGARRERTERRGSAARNGDGDGTDGHGGVKGPVGGEAARRRAERRARAITAGATELEQRLADLLRGGLAGADRSGYGVWDEMAARMVDAQAPGLAGRIRELSATPSSGPGWPERLLSECALLHLLDQGYLRLETLPEPLAATVRARVGLTVDTARLLADEEARQRDDWLVLAQRDTPEGKLTVRRIWLYGRASRRHALVLGFGAAGRAPQVSLPVGAVFDADLAFHPGARPLRAALGERHGPPGTGFVPDAVGGGTVTDALAGYAAALCDDPWLDGWPTVLTGVIPVPDEHGHGVRQLADAEGEAALPVAPRAAASGLWKLAALSGGEPLTVFGECGHRGFEPYTAWAPGAPGAVAVPL